MKDLKGFYESHTNLAISCKVNPTILIHIVDGGN